MSMAVHNLYWRLSAEVSEAEARTASLRAQLARIDPFTDPEKRLAQEIGQLAYAHSYRGFAAQARSVAEKYK